MLHDYTTNFELYILWRIQTEPISAWKVSCVNILRFMYVCVCIYIYIYTHTYMHINTRVYTECFTTCRYYYRRWFHRSLWSKRSYKHMSDFGRLRSYGHFFIPVHALVWTASYGTSWKVMYSACWLIVCGSCNEQLAQFTTERQAVLRPAVAFSKISFKHR